LNTEVTGYFDKIPPCVFSGIVANKAQRNPVAATEVGKSSPDIIARSKWEYVTPSRHIIVENLSILVLGVPRFKRVSEHYLPHTCRVQVHQFSFADARGLGLLPPSWRKNMSRHNVPGSCRRESIADGNCLKEAFSSHPEKADGEVSQIGLTRTGIGPFRRRKRGWSQEITTKRLKVPVIIMRSYENTG